MHETMKPCRCSGVSLMVLLTILVLISVAFRTCDAHMVGNDPRHRREFLDWNGKYQLEWRVDWPQQRVTFNVTVETKGYVGFGLTRKGKMTGADIVIGGVMPSGKPYFSDRHAVANQLPEEDPSQDWTLHGAHESDTHTFLSFSRAFDTCDPQDYPITEDKISIIWAFGERDNDIAYHYRNRGEHHVYLLRRDYTPPIVQNRNVGARQSYDGFLDETIVDSKTRDLKIWTVNSRIQIPVEDTTYWCTMHKAPSLPRKHHVVGYEVRFADEQRRTNLHHMALHRCRAPAGRDPNQMFAPYLQHRGQHCLFLHDPLGPIPTEYCSEYYSVFGVGGRPNFYPPHVGFPFGESPDEFYLLQTHYDNPNRLSNVVVDVSIDYYYTSELRPNDAGILDMRHDSPGLTPSLLIPPSSMDQTTYGLCGGGCTRDFLPREGIRVYGVLLHSHNTGVAIRLQHFRGNRELRWISSDDNYSFDFQQAKMLNREARVMPGDMLAVRCIYDNTRANGTVVGGFASQHEMCVVFLFHYTKISNYSGCGSVIESEEARERFLGIRNITWSNLDLEYIVDSPEEFAGMKVSEVSDNHVNWDMERREKLNDFHLREPHVYRCPRDLHSYPAFTDLRDMNEFNVNNRRYVSYPHEAEAYQPRRSCSFQK